MTLKCGRPNISDGKKNHESKPFGLLNLEITVILFYCARVESSKRRYFQGWTTEVKKN